MYICICRAVTERAIRRAIEDGARTLAELHAHLGVASDCGTCECAARDVLEETLEQQMVRPPNLSPRGSSVRL